MITLTARSSLMMRKSGANNATGCSHTTVDYIVRQVRRLNKSQSAMKRDYNQQSSYDARYNIQWAIANDFPFIHNSFLSIDFECREIFFALSLKITILNTSFYVHFFNH